MSPDVVELLRRNTCLGASKEGEVALRLGVRRIDSVFSDGKSELDALCDPWPTLEFLETAGE